MALDSSDSGRGENVHATGLAQPFGQCLYHVFPGNAHRGPCGEIVVKSIAIQDIFDVGIFVVGIPRRRDKLDVDFPSQNRRRKFAKRFPWTTCRRRGTKGATKLCEPLLDQRRWIFAIRHQHHCRRILRFCFKGGVRQVQVAQQGEQAFVFDVASHARAR